MYLPTSKSVYLYHPISKLAYERSANSIFKSQSATQRQPPGSGDVAGLSQQRRQATPKMQCTCCLLLILQTDLGIRIGKCMLFMFSAFVLYNDLYVAYSWFSIFARGTDLIMNLMRSMQTLVYIFCVVCFCFGILFHKIWKFCYLKKKRVSVIKYAHQFSQLILRRQSRSKL